MLHIPSLLKQSLPIRSHRRRDFRSLLLVRAAINNKPCSIQVSEVLLDTETIFMST